MYYVGSIPCIEYDVLIHYGIPGMKWGVRRFQNKDGTLTDAGKSRRRDTAKQISGLNREYKDAVRKLKSYPGYDSALNAEVKLARAANKFGSKYYGAPDNVDVDALWNEHVRKNKKLSALKKTSDDFASKYIFSKTDRESRFLNEAFYGEAAKKSRR